MILDFPKVNEAAGLGTGLFTIPAAAELVGVSALKMRRWFDYEPVASPLLKRVDDAPVLTFADVVTALFVKSFREQGVSLQWIRCVARVAAEELKVTHPFAVHRFAAAGKDILLRTSREMHGEGRNVIISLARGQYGFEAVFSPLFESLDYEIDDVARRWWPLGRERFVAVDPRVAFGAPTVRGVPTRVLRGPVRAGDSPDRVARWYGVSEAEVLAACEYEDMIHAKAA